MWTGDGTGALGWFSQAQVPALIPKPQTAARAQVPYGGGVLGVFSRYSMRAFNSGQRLSGLSYVGSGSVAPNRTIEDWSDLDLRRQSGQVAM